MIVLNNSVEFRIVEDKYIVTYDGFCGHVKIWDLQRLLQPDLDDDAITDCLLYDPVFQFNHHTEIIDWEICADSLQIVLLFLRLKNGRIIHSVHILDFADDHNIKMLTEMLAIATPESSYLSLGQEIPLRRSKRIAEKNRNKIVLQ